MRTSLAVIGQGYGRRQLYLGDSAPFPVDCEMRGRAVVELSAHQLLTGVAASQWGLFTTKQALEAGLSRSTLQWESRPSGRFEQLLRGVYRLRDYPAPALQPLGAALLASGPGAVACGRSAAWALGLDGVEPGCLEVAVLPSRSHVRSHARRRLLVPSEIIPLGPFWMTDPITTLLDLAIELDDIKWEWSLESAARKGLVTIPALTASIDRRAQLHWMGVARARHVLVLRGVNARPTDSQLETEFIQLIRPVPEIPEGERQLPVYRHDRLVARLDVAFPPRMAYTEVHGSQHRESLPYDANRETIIAGTLGWLASEVTSLDIRRTPKATIGRMVEFIATATRRAASCSI
jgi:hypothetical protein